MARANQTRKASICQKKTSRVAVIPFVESEILVDGSVYLSLPPRVMITRIWSNITGGSATVNATLDIVYNGTVLVNELAAVAVDLTAETLVAAAQYSATGGELVIKAGAVTPAAGNLVGELIVEYIELDRNTGEYTEMLSS